MHQREVRVDATGHVEWDASFNIEARAVSLNGEALHVGVVVTNISIDIERRRIRHAGELARHAFGFELTAHVCVEIRERLAARPQASAQAGRNWRILLEGLHHPLGAETCRARG